MTTPATRPVTIAARQEKQVIASVRNGIRIPRSIGMNAPSVTQRKTKRRIYMITPAIRIATSAVRQER